MPVTRRPWTDTPPRTPAPPCPPASAGGCDGGGVGVGGGKAPRGPLRQGPSHTHTKHTNTGSARPASCAWPRRHAAAHAGFVLQAPPLRPVDEEGDLHAAAAPPRGRAERHRQGQSPASIIHPHVARWGRVCSQNTNSFSFHADHHDMLIAVSPSNKSVDDCFPFKHNT
jgi:hypothetical protein